MKCEDCRFWIRNEDINVEDGQCRRFPPQVHMLPTEDQLGRKGFQTMIMFPAVGEQFWCGEFQPRIQLKMATTLRERLEKEDDATM